MKKLKILEDVPMDTALYENEYLVYNAMLEEIEKVYLDKKIKEVKVLELTIAGVGSHLTIDKKIFGDALKNCLKYFEKPEIEEYEKCTKCIKMINYLNKK